MWAAEPHLEARKRIGFQVMIFLIVFAGLLYFTKKKVWKAVEGCIRTDLEPRDNRRRASIVRIDSRGRRAIEAPPLADSTVSTTVLRDR